MEENIINLLILCRQKSRTLHFVKDKFNFSNKKLRVCMEYLRVMEYVTVATVKGDGRGTKQISTTDKGKEYLTSKGVKYNESR